MTRPEKAFRVSRRVSLAIFRIAVFALSFASLVSGASWLGIPLLEVFPLPLGNLVAKVLYVSLAALPVLATRPGTPSRIVAWLLLSAAVLWLPVSIGLAGNLNLNFSSWRGELWLWYSLGVLPGGSLLLLLSQLIRRALDRRKGTARPGQSSLAGNHP